MWVSIDLCVVPIGVGVSLSPYITACQKIIQSRNLEYQLGPNGTSIEGEWNDVFECVKACHEGLHQLGVIRIYTTVKINTRIDRKQSFYEKVNSVQSSLSS
tara:strand:- start:1978 stop:2280 length:303 start_codon:yes stop_codon:yes gene_type:complete